jgi:hypothetical protein
MSDRTPLSGTVEPMSEKKWRQVQVQIEKPEWRNTVRYYEPIPEASSEPAPESPAETLSDPTDHPGTDTD